jgi:hypothetical protein
VTSGWFASHNVAGGKKLHEQIDEAIRLHERLMLILSENSIESEWIRTEIAKARKREVREDRRVLFPLLWSSSIGFWNGRKHGRRRTAPTSAWVKAAIRRMVRRSSTLPLKPRNGI